MRDIHCHILPGVDDGAADLDESLAMLEAAKRAGVTRIVCTPHCRDPYFDYDKMWDAFELLRDNADGFPLQMGFEVNHRKLVELGIDAAEHLHFDGTNEFLLVLSKRIRIGMRRKLEQKLVGPIEMQVLRGIFTNRANV